MPVYLVRDKQHQCCEISADSVEVDKETGDLVFKTSELEVARMAAGWVGYAVNTVVIGYQVVECG